MTTIVLDCKEQMLYADELITTTSTARSGLVFPIEDEWKHFSTEHTKVYQTQYGTVAGSGHIETITLFKREYPMRLTIPQRDARILVCKTKGDGVHVEIFKTIKSKRWFQKYEWEQETLMKYDGYITIGSGSDYAMGALVAGVCPTDAIKAASKLDIHTGYQVKSFKLEQTL